MLTQTFYAEFPAFVRRFFLSLAALAIGYGAGFGTDRVMRGLFRLGSKTEGTLIWFAIFSIFGWLVFALPVLVISPWRKLFRRVGWSGLVGGVVGAGLFVNAAAILSRGELLRSRAVGS